MINNFKFKNRYINQLINDKELTLHKMFGLYEPPIKNSITDKAILVENCIESAKNEAVKIKISCDKDLLTDANEQSTTLIDSFRGVLSQLDNIAEDEYSYYKAYTELMDLFIRILEDEKIDISKYSNHITSSEWKIITRKKKIDNLLDE